MQEKEKNKFRCLTSWDDGNKLDFKIAELLKKYDLPGIFFIPSWSSYTNIGVDGVKKLYDMGFIVGAHTKTHPQDMKRLTKEQQENEIVLNKRWLENIIDDEVKWFCYPGGRYNDITVDIVKDHFKYARTTVTGFHNVPDDNFRIKTSVHIYPHEKYKMKWLQYAKLQFDYAIQNDGVFHVWGHSWEVTQLKLWDELEELFKYIKENK